MSDVLTIRPGERGVVRVFALDMRPEEARFLRDGAAEGAVAQALGVDTLDPARVELFPTSDLGDLGLTGYLVDGAGIPAEALHADAATLDALDGWVMVVHSRAFGDGGVTLDPAPQIGFVGAWSEPGSDWQARPVTADSARAYSAPPLPPRAARAEARRRGAGVFAVVMLAIVLLIWWLAA